MHRLAVKYDKDAVLHTFQFNHQFDLKCCQLIIRMSKKVLLRKSLVVYCEIIITSFLMNPTAAVKYYALRELISITLGAHQLWLCMLLIFSYLNKIKNRGQGQGILAEVDADAVVTERAHALLMICCKISSSTYSQHTEKWYRSHHAGIDPIPLPILVSILLIFASVRPPSLVFSSISFSVSLLPAWNWPGLRWKEVTHLSGCYISVDSWKFGPFLMLRGIYSQTLQIACPQLSTVISVQLINSKIKLLKPRWWILRLLDLDNVSH